MGNRRDPGKAATLRILCLLPSVGPNRLFPLVGTQVTNGPLPPPNPLSLNQINRLWKSPPSPVPHTFAGRITKRPEHQHHARTAEISSELPCLSPHPAFGVGWDSPRPALLRSYFDLGEHKKHPVTDIGPPDRNFHTKLVLVMHIWES